MKRKVLWRAGLAIAICSQLFGCAALPPGFISTTAAMPKTGKFIATLNATNTVQPGRYIRQAVMIRRPLAAATGVAVDPQFVGYCQHVIARLLAGWPYDRPDVTVFIVPSSNFSSDTTPEGAIIISTGLLHYLVTHPNPDNGDRLAFVLAHELSHVLMGQTNDRYQIVKDAEALRGLVYLGSSLTLGATASRIAEASQKAVFSSYFFGLTANRLIFPAWQREQEGKADLLAIDLMAKAGYNLQGATDVLSILVAQQNKEAKVAVKIKALREYVGMAGPDGQHMVNVGVKASIRPYVADVMAIFRAGHPAAIARMKTAQKYIAREYPTYLAPMGGTGFAAVSQEAPTRLMIADEARLGRAMAALGQHQPVEAETELAGVRSVVLRGSEYFAYIQAITASSLGRQDDAVRELSWAADQRLATQPVMVLKARLLLAAHDNEGALQAFTAADQRFHTEAYLPQRIEIEQNAGNHLQASLMVEQCNLTGKMRLIAECDKAHDE